MRNMVAYRPSISRILLSEGAISAIESLTNPQLDHELSADPSQLERQRRQMRAVHPVPPVPRNSPSPPLPLTPHSSIASPTTSSPQHSPNLRSSPLPMDERRAWRESSGTAPPTTPTSGCEERRFSMKSLARRSSFKFSKHDRRVSASSCQDPTLIHPRPPMVTQHHLSQTNPRRAPSLIPTPAQERLLGDYKAQAAKRAMELSQYLRQWTEYAPDKLPTLQVPPRLEALGAGVGWLSEWEGASWTSSAER